MPVLRVPQQCMRSNPLIKDGQCTGPRWWAGRVTANVCAQTYTRGIRHGCGLQVSPACCHGGRFWIITSVVTQGDVRLSHSGMLSLKQVLSNKEMSF